MILSFSYSENLKFWMRTKTWNERGLVRLSVSLLTHPIEARAQSPLSQVPKPLVGTCCLSRMAFVAKTLQIRLIVKKRLIPMMGDNVINVRRQCEDALLQTLLAMRMLREKTVAQYLPAVAVTPFGRRTFLLAPALETNLMGFLFCLSVSFDAYHQMLRAETLTARHGVETPWKLTKRHQWHKHLKLGRCLPPPAAAAPRGETNKKARRSEPLEKIDN